VSTDQQSYGVTTDQFRGEKSLFTEITDQMRTATERRTYQPYFQALQQTKQGSFMSALSGKLGTTQSGKSLGFAGSGVGDSIQSNLEMGYANEIMGIEEQIQDKQERASGLIDDVIAANKSTALQLKQIEAM
tara:strand:- start:460 stop:855 length:396 start_codon:yes stop_codon:yes gene_type:complete